VIVVVGYVCPDAAPTHAITQSSGASQRKKPEKGEEARMFIVWDVSIERYGSNAPL
jgi:hypothetical protein